MTKQKRNKEENEEKEEKTGGSVGHPDMDSKIGKSNGHERPLPGEHAED